MHGDYGTETSRAESAAVTMDRIGTASPGMAC
jgi:hypothetical protein